MICSEILKTEELNYDSISGLLRITVSTIGAPRVLSPFISALPKLNELGFFVGTETLVSGSIVGFSWADYLKEDLGEKCSVDNRLFLGCAHRVRHKLHIHC
jgi:hypothetical protein